MATWPYAPQAVLTTALTAPNAFATVVAPQTVVAGATAALLQRAFQLTFATVTSADAAGMRAFFTQQLGSFMSFDFLHPSDQQAYRVRFESTMQLEWFSPPFFRTNPLTFVVVSG